VRESGNLLGTLQTDHGGEFSAIHFKQYCEDLRISHQLTAPYTQQQNGVVEHRNQSVMGATQCILRAKNLPGMF
jgi:transposase InsO family protein